MKNFADFLKVSDFEVEDVMQWARIFNVATANSEQMYCSVTELDLLVLIKLALQNPEVDKLCKLPIFDNYWSEIWRKCGNNPREEAQFNGLPVHEYQCQVTISAFDFIKSVAVHEEYLAIINSGVIDAESLALPYLAAAVNLDYFPALVIAHQMFTDLASKKQDPAYIFDAIAIARRAADKYWAAGYFLLGITYLKTEKPDLFFITEGIKALVIAKKLEPYSQEMLNTAFQGNSLYEVTSGEIKDWDGILDYYSRYQRSLKIIEINQIFKAANETVEAIKSKWLDPEVVSGLKFGF